MTEVRVNVRLRLRVRFRVKIRVRVRVRLRMRVSYLTEVRVRLRMRVSYLTLPSSQLISSSNQHVRVLKELMTQLTVVSRALRGSRKVDDFIAPVEPGGGPSP